VVQASSLPLTQASKEFPVRPELVEGRGLLPPFDKLKTNGGTPHAQVSTFEHEAIEL